DDQSGPARADMGQASEQRRGIVERAERVDDHDEVERAGQGAHKSGVLDVADQEREFGMRLARLRDHAGTEIHPDAERRLERGEKVADAASELEDARAFGNEELQIAQI